MNNFFEELKSYFEQNDQNTILSDWEKSKEYDKIGPSMKDFLGHTQRQSIVYTNHSIILDNQNFNYNLLNLKYSSGFFM
jgi:hypothetical protein